MKILMLFLFVSCSSITPEMRLEKSVLLKAFDFCSSRGGIEGINKYETIEDISYVGYCKSREPFYLSKEKELKHERKYSTIPKDIY